MIKSQKWELSLRYDRASNKSLGGYVMGKIKRKAVVDTNLCVACGACEKVCPLHIITIEQGVFAKIQTDKCVGCGKCAKVCPASVIEIRAEEVE